MTGEKILTVDQVNEITGDDITYWLGNPFLTPDMLIAKVCWWMTQAATPTPVPSEVAETTAGEREVEALAYLFGEHASIGSDERRIDGEWVWGFDCECGEFTPDTEVNEHLARAVLTSPALAALLDRVRREEGERIAQAIERIIPRLGVQDRELVLDEATRIARAASVGRGEGQ